MVNIASGKHKLSHSVSLCFSYKSSGSSFSFLPDFDTYLGFRFMSYDRVCR